VKKIYLKYWGKAGFLFDKYSCHLLPYHCLDVAAVGRFLLDPEKPLCRHLAARLKVCPDWLQNFFVFCLCLHDIGKFARAFQGLQPKLHEVYPNLIKPDSRMSYDSKRARHDSLGYRLLMDCSISDLQKLFQVDNKLLKNFSPWFEIVTGHHGMPPIKSGFRRQSFFKKEDENAAYEFIKDVYTDLFAADIDFTPLQDKGLKKRLKNISWQLAGIAVLSDWIGSNQNYFDFVEDEKGIVDYWNNHALPVAKSALHSMRPPVSTTLFKDIKNLFPFISTPTPLQEYAAKVSLDGGPHLFILEDVTGAGKTEAALILTHRLLGSGLADGLYVALPTMATANAMYERLSQVYRSFYDNENLPSLILAHGGRVLSEQFRNSVFIPKCRQEGMSYIGSVYNDDCELCASAYCNAWLADNRKKALLADVGVGTIDQALLSILPVRHQSLRILGLYRKILFVDEVHAYDNYMQQLLDNLLEMHARQGGSVILLSATLPGEMRRKLVAAFYRGLDVQKCGVCQTAYPQVTHSCIKGTQEFCVDTRQEVKRTVKVLRLNTEDNVLEVIRSSVDQGKCVCWVRNTVKAARQIHQRLAQCEWIASSHLHLFHSRFAMIDRQRIEQNIVTRFGKYSGKEERKGQVLIATQVVEQSLDLDFDVLITDLAPIDLVLQRAGRLCRHVRDVSGKTVRAGNTEKDWRGTPVLYLFCPDPFSHADANWLDLQQKGTKAVYPHLGLLWLTAKILLHDKDGGEFVMPDDARKLIEGVYGPETENKIPNAIMDCSCDAIVRDMVQENMADLNALNLGKGYTWGSGEWDEEIHTPTRLSEVETVTVALVRMKDGRMYPYANEVKQYKWVLSTVKVPVLEWEKARKDIPLSLQTQINEIKKNVKALHWQEVFPLVAETQSYYTSEGGWIIEKGENL